MTDTRHERYEQDLPAYALGALDQAESADFERHLADCEACQADLRRLAPALNALALSVEPHEPPTELRERLLATVRAETDGEATAARPTGVRAVVRRLRAIALPRLPVLAAGAAALAAAFVIGFAVHGGTGSPSVATIPVRSASPHLAATGVLIRRDDGASTLQLARLREPHNGRVYQLWIRHGTQIQPSTVFVPARDGSATVAIAGDLAGADELMITREPRGGSRTPTTKPILHVQLG